jgi:hypothetical protein
MRDYSSPWESVRVEADEFRALDDEPVLVLIRQHGRGKTSGDGAFGRGHGCGERAARPRQTGHEVHPNWDRDRALADLGLEK